MVQLTTAPRFAEYVRRFLGLERQSRLSAAALETLAIVAYRQPVTRSEIESVRGVDCTGVLATLLQRSLIEAIGRGETPGNPNLYGTTPEFLMHFGLGSLDELPPLGDVNGQDCRSSPGGFDRPGSGTCLGINRGRRHLARARLRTRPAISTIASAASSISASDVARPTVRRRLERACSTVAPIASST